MTERIERAAEMFRVLGHAGRLALVTVLLESPRAVGELAEELGLAQPTVSQHLRVLRDAGLVGAEADGRARRYSVLDFHVDHVVRDALAHSDEPHPGEGRPADEAD